MRAIKKVKITYSDPISTGCGINTGQHIFLDSAKEPIGWLETRFDGIFNPLKEIYQFGIGLPESELKTYNYYESEDEDWFYVTFETLESFLAGYKLLKTTKNLNKRV